MVPAIAGPSPFNRIATGSSAFWIGSISPRNFNGSNNALGEAFEQSLESAKWKLWHGEATMR